jgi:hypothetical protein
MDPRIIAAAAGVAALALLWGAWWLWWQLPKRQMRSITAADPKARADIEDNFRKTITQLLAGLVTLFAGIVALSAAVIAYLQLSQQQKSSHDLLISNQVAKGFEQLGSDKVVVRLGGIFALEGVMNTSKEYYQPVLEALCAFVRDETKADKKETREGPPASDVQAALTVIGRRAAIGRPVPFLANAHIPKTILNEADLRAYLVGADLRGSQPASANLRGAYLYGADLSDAYLVDANLSHADLPGANLSGADLSGADLTGANLRGAIITQPQLGHACGTDVTLDPGLTIKPCPSRQ